MLYANYIEKSSGDMNIEHLNNKLLLVQYSGAQMAFEYRTIWPLDNSQSLEYRTSLVFISPLCLLL